MQKVFFDSDVIISAVLSTKGASYLLTQHPNIEKLITNYSLVELQIVTNRIGLDKSKLDKIIQSSFIVKELTDKFSVIQARFERYVNDPYDTHVIAGASISECSFLVTFNLKDYQVVKIKNELNIIIITPGHLLQYLRSRG